MPASTPICAAINVASVGTFLATATAVVGATDTTTVMMTDAVTGDDVHDQEVVHDPVDETENAPATVVAEAALARPNANQETAMRRNATVPDLAQNLTHATVDAADRPTIGIADAPIQGHRVDQGLASANRIEEQRGHALSPALSLDLGQGRRGQSHDLFLQNKTDRLPTNKT